MRPTCYDCGIPTTRAAYTRCPSCANKARRVPNRQRFYSHVGAPDNRGCRYWLAVLDRDGYGFFTWMDSAGIQKQVRAHHAALMLEGIEIPQGLEVRHTCDVPSCVEVSHLLVDTHEANIADRNNKGHTARGAASHKSNLTEQDVLAIRARPELTLKALAGCFHVDIKTIQRIRRRETWKHV